LLKKLTFENTGLFTHADLSIRPLWEGVLEKSTGPQKDHKYLVEISTLDFKGDSERARQAEKLVLLAQEAGIDHVFHNGRGRIELNHTVTGESVEKAAGKKAHRLLWEYSKRGLELADEKRALVLKLERLKAGGSNPKAREFEREISELTEKTREQIDAVKEKEMENLARLRGLAAKIISFKTRARSFDEGVSE